MKALSMSWPKSVLLVGGLLIFLGVPILGEDTSVKIALAIITLWYLIGPGTRYTRGFFKRLGF